MKQLIDKSDLVAEIERRIKGLKDCYAERVAGYAGEISGLERLLSFLDTIEVKEINEELQGLEKEVAEGTVNRINKKRIPIELKGEVKAKFKNEFHTMWQTIHGISFANVAKPILERLCLHFAAWGVYNLKEYIEMKPEEVKLDAVKVKEMNLEKELKTLDNTLFDLDGVAVQGATHYLTVEDVKDIARGFFELGLKAQKGE